MSQSETDLGVFTYLPGKCSTVQQWASCECHKSITQPILWLANISSSLCLKHQKFKLVLNNCPCRSRLWPWIQIRTEEAHMCQGAQQTEDVGVGALLGCEAFLHLALADVGHCSSCLLCLLLFGFVTRLEKLRSLEYLMSHSVRLYTESRLASRMAWVKCTLQWQ